MMTIRGNNLLGVEQRTTGGYQPVRMTARGQSSYKCPNCDRFYMRTSCLKRHLRVECGQEPQYQCRICQGWFKYKHNLSAHMKLHMEEPKHHCTISPLSSLYRAIVRSHCVLVNGTLKEFACNLCPRTYSTLRALRFHQRIECNREPRFTCGWCDYRTLRRSYYSCESCGKGYNTLGSLKFHKNVECSREPSFACTYCIYKSRRRSNLHRHMKVHSMIGRRRRILPFAGLKIPKASSFNYLGKKPAGQFACNRCGRSYMRKDSLQRHTHWECGKEPQFHCPFCPQRCKRKAHWLRHIRRQHFEKIGDMEAHLLAYTPKLEID
ncbi:hypothetical protein HZH68_012357 [Vespula germanica]|uniref:C2H2-type domain-containing protein n=1 Tax=Vespula germanica TaxID=30212 RepID=A0A834MXR9_VESGE|nr:hypothetical protein HZH68_012357 [Vespula germanica]